MLPRIVEFVEVLRQNGLRVALTETLDALSAVEAVGLQAPDTLRVALKATLVKAQKDVPDFDRAFDAFFLRAAGAPTNVAEWQPGAGTPTLDSERIGDASALLDSSSAELLRLLIQQASGMDWSRLQTPLQTGYLARRLFSAMGGSSAQRDLELLPGELAAQGKDPHAIDAFIRRARAQLARLETLTRQYVEQQVRARLRPRTDTVVDRPLVQLSPQEIQQAEMIVRKVAARLKAKVALKPVHRRRGFLHVQRTLRRNVGWGGIPMRPVFRARRPAKPEIVVLCDVSDSVRNASRMMLLFTHALQSLFSRVRSFIFVAELGEVTDVFRGSAPGEAFQKILSDGPISLYANSDYGQAFREFADRHLGSITRRSTVLILGDGRNNGNPANEWVVEELRLRAKQVVWLCTEDVRGWGVGDSEMLRYAPHCNQVAQVLTLRDLELAAELFVPR